MKPYIQIAIRTKAETTGWGVGETIVDSLELNGGLLIPEQISHNADKFTEPYLGKASCEGMWASKASIRTNGALSEFYQDFAWKRKRSIRSLGSVVHTSRNARGQLIPGSVTFSAAFNEKADWLSLFKIWCRAFPPQLGMLHAFAGPELMPAERNSSFRIGSFNAVLKPDIPNVGWAMFYGDEFAQEVDVDRIAASGFPVEAIGNGYLVRVTEDIQDVARNFSLFSERRAELKRLFREGLFLVNHEPSP